MTRAQKFRNGSRDPDYTHIRVIIRLILHMVNSYTKFEVSSFSCCIDILGGVKVYSWSHGHNRALCRDHFVMERLGLIILNLCTKFEFSAKSVVLLTWMLK